MDSLNTNIPFDLQMSDRFNRNAMVEMAHVMVIQLNQKVLMVVDNSQAEGVAHVQSIFVTLFGLPLTMTMGIEHNCVLREVLESWIEMKCSVIGRFVFNGKALTGTAKNSSVHNYFCVALQTTVDWITKWDNWIFNSMHRFRNKLL